VFNNNKITGIILAGGKSSRMGMDKGFCALNGKPMVQYAIDILEQTCDSIIICSNNSDYELFDLPVIPDIIKDIGPMGGIYSGLKNSKTQWVSTKYISKNKKINKSNVDFFTINKEKNTSYVNMNSSNLNKIIKSIGNFPSNKSEFETSYAFEIRREKYIKKYNNLFNNVVYVIRENAISRFDADAGTLVAKRTPPSIYATEYISINEKVSSRKTLHKNLQNSLNIILSKYDSDVFRSSYSPSIDISVEKAKKFKNKYYWLFGVKLDLDYDANYGHRYDSKPKIEESDFKYAIKKYGYSNAFKHSLYSKNFYINGSEIFSALVVDGVKEPIYINYFME